MRVQQSGATVEKAPGRGEMEAKEKKVKILEHQRREVRTRERAVLGQHPGQGCGAAGKRCWSWDLHPAPPQGAFAMGGCWGLPWLAGGKAWAPVQPFLSPCSYWR